MLDKFKSLTGAVSSLKPKSGGQDQYIVALDIGTENVKALIGRVNGDRLEIVGAGRAHQKLSDMQAGAVADIAGVVGNCDAALSEAEQQAGVSVCAQPLLVLQESWLRVQPPLLGVLVRTQISHSISMKLKKLLDLFKNVQKNVPSSSSPGNLVAKKSRFVW
mgnify:CR=1 FL=1